MDIDLLAKMVKEVVLRHDSVTLPGVGSFVAELVPAAFADRGYTILPPYRRLYFSPRQGSDTLLADFYRQANPELSEADATRILTDFLSGMKEVLKQRKTLVLPGLGRLRATRENHFFFVADEDLDIWPAGFGLQPISLKTHEETPEEVATAVSALANILEQKQPDVVEQAAAEPEEPDASPASAQPEPVSIEQAEADDASSSAEMMADATPDAPSVSAEPEPVIPGEASVSPGWKMFWRVLLILVLVALVLLVALAVVGRVAPQWLDSFLYSPEELEILRQSY